MEMRTGFWKSGIKRGPVSHHGSLSSAVPPYISLSFRLLKRGQTLVCTNEQHLNLITHKTQLSVEHFQDKVAGNTKNCFPSRECFLKGTQSVTAVRVISIRMEQNYTLHSFPVNLWSCLFSKTESHKNTSATDASFVSAVFVFYVMNNAGVWGTSVYYRSLPFFLVLFVCVFVGKELTMHYEVQIQSKKVHRTKLPHKTCKYWEFFTRQFYVGGGGWGVGGHLKSLCLKKNFRVPLHTVNCLITVLKNIWYAQI